MQSRPYDTTNMFSGDIPAADSSLNFNEDSNAVSAVSYPSMFTDLGKVKEISPKEIGLSYHPPWVPIILLSGFFLIAWVKIFFWRRLQMIFRAVFARNFANQLIREGNLFNERPGLILFIVYLLVMAMLAYQTMHLFNIAYPFRPWLMYLLLAGFFLALWFLKVFLVNALSKLFNTPEHSLVLLANMFLYNLFIGIILLPLVSILSFTDSFWILYIGLFIIVFLYFMRLIRSVQTGTNITKFSVFHLILYLCTLEILPLIVLAKILTRNLIL